MLGTVEDDDVLEGAEYACGALAEEAELVEAEYAGALAAEEDEAAWPAGIVEVSTTTVVMVVTSTDPAAVELP